MVSDGVSGLPGPPTSHRYTLRAMPIYEYRCTNDHRFEVLQRFSDDPIEVCEVCGAPAVRVLHPVAIHFKGSGFYNTDYGKGKKKGSRRPRPTAASPSRRAPTPARAATRRSPTPADPATPAQARATRKSSRGAVNKTEPGSSLFTLVNGAAGAVQRALGGVLRRLLAQEHAEHRGVLRARDEHVLTADHLRACRRGGTAACGWPGT